MAGTHPDRSRVTTDRRRLLRGLGIGLAGAIAGCSSEPPERQIRKLSAATGSVRDNFGTVAVDGDTVLIGAPGHASSAGVVYVYVRTKTVWRQQAKLIADDADETDIHGSAVAVSGNTALSGAAGDADSNGVNGGSGYVFARSGETRRQEANLAAADENTGNSLGFSVVLS